MPESTVQWRKESLRYGLVQLHSIALYLPTHLKNLDRSRKKNMAFLRSTIPFVFQFPFISFGTTFYYMASSASGQDEPNRAM